ADQRRAGLPDCRTGLRAAQGLATPDQPLDRARNRRRNQAARHSEEHFPTPRGAPVKKGALKPHLIRYWLTPPTDERLDQTIAEDCTVYTQASARAAQGERTVSTDEMTGVQALERKHANLPLAPGKVERRE